VDDVNRELARGIVLELVRAAEVDDRTDPVVEERSPARVREKPDAVGANDPTVPCLATVPGRMAAEIPNVETAFPGELSLEVRHSGGDCCNRSSTEGRRGRPFDLDQGQLSGLGRA
jgi:hypothetical protein